MTFHILNCVMSKVYDRGVIFPDIHFPKHDELALRTALKVIEAVKPTYFLNLGDIVEGDSVSAWKWKRKKRPPLEYQLPEIIEELKLINEGFDRIDEVLDKVKCKKRVFAQGNHEIWFDNFVDEHPYLPEYKSYEALKIKERGYDWHPYGKIFKVNDSKLHAYHGGHYMGLNHAKSHVQNLGVNVIYGHTHDNIKSVVTHMDGPKMAQSMGCLCKMEKSFLKNRQTNWTHNVGIVDFYDDGLYNLIVLNIIDGKPTYNGKVIKG